MLLIAVTFRRFVFKKPIQVKCFEYLLKGKDIVVVLPTGFGKSRLLMCEHISNLQRLFNTRISVQGTRLASRKALSKEF